MARSKKIHPEYRAAALSRADRLRCRLHGAVDGSLGVHCPLPSHGRVPWWRGQPQQSRTGAVNGLDRGAPAEAWTAFIELAHNHAEATSNQLIAGLMEGHLRKVGRVYRQADVVCRQLVEGEVSASAVGRFVSEFNDWRAIVGVCRAQAEAAVSYANQVIDHYWMAVVRSHRRRFGATAECARLRPPRAVIDPVWNKPDTFLLMRFGPDGDDETTALAARTLACAIELVARYHQDHTTEED